MGEDIQQNEQFHQRTALKMKSFTLEKGTESNPIPLSDFLMVVTQLSANNEFGFEEEFMSLPMKFPYPSTFALENPNKNRYEDIHPYDHSRVALTRMEETETEDNLDSTYINASYFDEKQYIGTQGPLPDTIVDLWRMVWEQCTKIIIMVTNLEENHVPKCEKYWPENINETVDYGIIQVTLLLETPKPEFVVRTLRVCHMPTGQETEVYQCQYIGWPDKGVPVCTYDVLDFIVYCRHLQNSLEEAGPMVVHCSAGVGRSGTFVILDQCISAIEDNVIDVVGSIIRMRKNRMWSVQTHSQYAFVYKALRDYILRQSYEINRSTIDTYLQENGVFTYKRLAILNAGLSNYNDFENTLSQLSIQYDDLLTEEKKVHTFLNSRAIKATNPALKKYNLVKNLSQEHIPYVNNRVVLKTVDGVAGTDYINASWVNGFERHRCYAVMPTPFESIHNDFWRMVFEHEIQTIVLIGLEASYWPDSFDDVKRYGNIQVRVEGTKDERWFVVRDFEITDTKSNVTRSIKQFHLTSWIDPESPPPPIAFVMFFNAIRGKTPDCDESENNRICIQSTTAGRAGCFLLLDMACRSLYVYDQSNIFVYAKRIRFGRFGLISNMNQYQYCYQTLQEYSHYLDRTQSPA